MNQAVLRAITEKEEKLAQQMMEGGYMEERDELNQAEDIYVGYSNIFIDYVNLALNHNAEALKRALFFIWYACAEPYTLSGIKDLDQKSAQKLLSLVNKLIISDGLDDELKWMLPYYFEVCDWYLNGYSDVDAILQYSKSLENRELYRAELKSSSFKSRCIFGEYWSSIV